MSNRYLKDKSLYSIKKLHANTSKGTIYENDYVTIVRHDGVFDEAPLFSDSNFKYKTRQNDDEKRRHVRSNWVLTDDNEEIWTKNDIGDSNNKNEEEIILKPNYSSLKDFAYYGSAVELIKSTINDIVKRFPGGIYYYDENLAPTIKIGNKTYFFVSNECQIDCWSDGITNVKDGENPLRYLSYSYGDYEIEKPKINISGNCIDSIIGTVEIGDKSLSIYKDNDGINHLVSANNGDGKIIEPKKEIIEKFWASLDDFERVLLNRFSNPLYTAIFDTPYQNEDGYYYTPKSYTWPRVSNSMTPDLTTIKFEYYLQSLLELAYFHDENDSDNMWRMMTHEAIKNLDWTYNSNGEDESDIDSSRIKSMVHIQGRQFDDIKRYIDNIKTVNSISYNEQNNVPDYFLSDITNNNGWETNVVMNTNELAPGYSITGNSESSSILSVSGKSSNEINNMFFRRLALSSNYIQSTKGTKRGIELILGMFGYNNDVDYEIREYSAKIKDGIDYDETVCIRSSFEYVNAEEMLNFMQGYPVNKFIDENDNVKLYPWYDSSEKYDYNFYYQCKGGWGKFNRMDVNRKDLTEREYIEQDVNEEMPFLIFSETEPYLLFANNIKELLSFPNDKIENGTLCYVSDISNMDYKRGKNEDGDYSNYFILKNKAFSTCLGLKNDCYGWYNIKKQELNERLSADGKKVLYLEEIKTNFKGNNPHTGKGKYDFGLSYLLKYKQLFKDAVDTGKCDELENKDEIEKYGFVFDATPILIDDKCKSYIGSGITEEDSLKVINIKNITILFKTFDIIVFN